MAARDARMHRLAAAALGANATTCEPPGHGTSLLAPNARATPVRGHVVATLNGETITDEDVASVARAEGITDVRQALDRAVDMRLLADEAARRDLGNDPLVTDTSRRGAIQALLATTVERVVRPDNLPRADFEAGMRIRGFELSHGELRATVHAVVLASDDAGLSAHESARDRAARLRDLVMAMPLPRTPESFQQLAERELHDVPHRVESLPAVDAQGRWARGDLAEPFAVATGALQQPGDVSPVVETTFGFHVIVLVSREPAVVRPEAEVRAMVAEELLWRLRHRELDEQLEALRARYHAQVREQALSEVEHARLVPEGS
jgi:peptidyl-prolyl cis-trans isomerase C